MCVKCSVLYASRCESCDEQKPVSVLHGPAGERRGRDARSTPPTRLFHSSDVSVLGEGLAGNGRTRVYLQHHIKFNTEITSSCRVLKKMSDTLTAVECN